MRCSNRAIWARTSSYLRTKYASASSVLASGTWPTACSSCPSSSVTWPSSLTRANLAASSTGVGGTVGATTGAGATDAAAGVAGRTAAGLAFFIAAGEGTAGVSAGWEESPCAGASGTISGTGRASAGTVVSAASADAGPRAGVIPDR